MPPGVYCEILKIQGGKQGQERDQGSWLEDLANGTGSTLPGR
jgi:hypothetical protein